MQRRWHQKNHQLRRRRSALARGNLVGGKWRNLRDVDRRFACCPYSVPLFCRVHRLLVQIPTNAVIVAADFGFVIGFRLHMACLPPEYTHARLVLRATASQSASRFLGNWKCSTSSGCQEHFVIPKQAASDTHGQTRKHRTLSQIVRTRAVLAQYTHTLTERHW